MLSAVLKHWGDLSIILLMLFINAGVGFWQEFKADNAIALLKQRLALKARVKRDGAWKDIEAKLLVPGDVVHVKLGNVVPADLKLIGGGYLSVDQSALTGELLPVDKKAGDDAYSGSIAKQGEMDGVVTATGMKTYFGKTAGLVQQAGTVSHFQRAVLRIGNFLIFITAGLVVIIVLAGLFRHNPLLELLQFALILAVASIPVALPAVLSVTMAVGAERLARMKAIVSRLVSIEEMAGVDTLCSDKTGTLTKNELTLGKPQPAPGVAAEELLLAAALASRRDEPDAIDSAILAGAPAGSILDSYAVKAFHPFDPVAKRAEADIEHGGERFKVAKGAPQVIVDICEPGAEQRAAISKTGRAGRRQGLPHARRRPQRRVQSGAFSVCCRCSTRRGTIATKRSRRSARWASTSRWSPATTRPSPKKSPASLISVKTSSWLTRCLATRRPADKLPQILSADGFARVFPEHKFDIVKALQGAGRIVGMTGDGVNDAPALKQADVGIAVSGATDAARAAAALVLTAPGLAVIATAIEEARRIFERMTSYAIYRIAETIRAPPVHDGEHIDLQLLSGHRDHDRAAGAV